MAHTRDATVGVFSTRTGIARQPKEAEVSAIRSPEGRIENSCNFGFLSVGASDNLPRECNPYAQVLIAIVRTPCGDGGAV